MSSHKARRALTGLRRTALAGRSFAGVAQAKLTGNYTKFAQFTYKNEELLKCIYNVTTSSEVVLGSKKVPIVNPVILQGGYGEAIEEKEGAEFAKFYAATNGVTLSKAAQPVPGGLAGIINCKEISDFFLRISCEVTFENGVTGLNSPLELARQATEISVTAKYLAGDTGTALQQTV